MASVSIVLSAKNAASAAFDQVRGEMKTTSDAANKYAQGISQANEGLSKAMSGDLVGAVRSATSAVKGLWAAAMANPLMAVTAAIGAATVALVKWHFHAKQVQADTAKAVADANLFSLSLDEIEKGSRIERETANATKASLQELGAELQKHINMAERKKELALEASEAAVKANESERESALAWAEQKKKIYADEMSIVNMLKKAISDRTEDQNKAEEKALENIAKETAAITEAAEKREESNATMYESVSSMQENLTEKIVASHADAVEEEEVYAAEIVGIHKTAAESVSETWEEVWKRRYSAWKEYKAKEAETGMYDENGNLNDTDNWSSRNGGAVVFGSGTIVTATGVTAAVASLSEMMDQTISSASWAGNRINNTMRSAGSSDTSVVNELRGIRQDQQKLLRFG